TPFTPIVDVAARGNDVWLLGGRPRPIVHDQLARSRDGGRTFQIRQGPCVPDLGGNLSPASATTVWAVCPTGMMAFAARSTDGRTTFVTLHTPPMPNSAVLAPASPTVAVLARSGGKPLLVRTTNGGRTWKASPPPPHATAVFAIAFTNARVGT